MMELKTDFMSEREREERVMEVIQWLSDHWDELIHYTHERTRIKPQYEIKKMSLKDICIDLCAGKSVEFSEADELEACEDSVWNLAWFDTSRNEIVIEELDEDGDYLDFAPGDELDIMQSMLEYGFVHPWYFVRTKA